MVDSLDLINAAWIKQDKVDGVQMYYHHEYGLEPEVVALSIERSLSKVRDIEAA